MQMSKLIGKTSKDIEDEFNIESQKLLLKAGMFENISPGVYSALPQGKKVVDKLIDFLSNKLEKEGFQKLFIPANKEFEMMCSLSLRNALKSYRDLPKAVYDIATLEREKIKLKDGLLKAKYFTNIRALSFYENEQAFLDGYMYMKELYKDLLQEIGLDILSLEAYNEKEPTLASKELLFLCQNGEKTIIKCKGCGHRALEEMANFANFQIEECEVDSQEIEPVHTPDIKTIKELEEFMNIDSKDLAKTLLIRVGKEIIAVLIRGNRDLNLYKLSRVLGIPIDEIRMADYEEIDGNIETVPGFVGPVELEGVRLIVDREITKIGSLITGANKKDYHLKNVKYNRDFVADLVADISYIRDDDKCAVCGESFTKEQGMDIGKILSLGKITNVNNMLYKDKEGKPQSIYGVSSYIDIYRLLCSIVEKYHDDNGIIWPINTAPYQVIISILNVKKEEQVILGKKLYNELKAKKLEVLLDDRNERAGAKFYDADLLGIPIRIVVARSASDNKVELKLRWKSEKEELDVNEALDKTLELLNIYKYQTSKVKIYI